MKLCFRQWPTDAQKGAKVQHEPKRVVDKGAPDFKISKSGLILGYVENKAIGEPLDKVLKSEQIARYKKLSQNIIVTDYLHFIWINKDGIQREALCHATDLENRKFRLREDRSMPSASCCKLSSQQRRKASAALSNWPWPWPRGASCCAIIWARN